jgi:Cof subfamily protein (haloacid dehalogenase superfamily)
MGMQPIRLIAYDLDGTVLNSRQGLSGRTKEAIQRAAAAGIYMIPATGRHLSEVPRPVKELSSSFVITNNGAQVYSLENNPGGSLVFSRAYDEKTALSLLAEFRGYPAMIFAAFDETGSFDAKGRGYDEGITRRIIVRNNWEDTDRPADLEKLITEKKKSIIKLVMIFEDLEERRRILNSLAGRAGLAVTYWAADNIEIMPAGVNKGAALKFTAARLGIGMEQVMAIGDSDNDREMIQAAGTGVAMGNAAEDIKRDADRITLPCDEDGAAAAIESALNGERGEG